jgi:hypothetical protein
MSETDHPPRSWRTAGALLVLLGGLGIALCAAGIGGSWVVSRSLIHSTSRACERAERILTVTADSLRAVRSGLEKAQKDLETLHEGAKGPASRPTPATR